jgi:hypothetical protein
MKDSGGNAVGKPKKIVQHLGVQIRIIFYSAKRFFLRELSFLDLMVAHEVLFSPLHNSNSNIRIRPNYLYKNTLRRRKHRKNTVIKEITVIIVLGYMALF